MSTDQSPNVKVEMRREIIIVSAAVEISWNRDARPDAVAAAERMVTYVENTCGAGAAGQFSAKPIKGSVRSSRSAKKERKA